MPRQAHGISKKVAHHRAMETQTVVALYYDWMKQLVEYARENPDVPLPADLMKNDLDLRMRDARREADTVTGPVTIDLTEYG